MDTKVWSNSNRMSRKYRSFRCCHRRNNRSLPPNSFVRGDTPKFESFINFLVQNFKQLPRFFMVVDTVFWCWRNDGTWQKIHDAMCRLVRQTKGKKPTPSAGIVDSQSADCTEVGGPERGYDAAKNVNGRKRHIMVDTLGWIMVIVIHAANIQDYDGARLVFQALDERFKRLKIIFADSAYGKTGLPDWVKQTFGWILQTVLRPVGVKGFVVLPKRSPRRTNLRMDQQVPPKLQRLRTNPQIK